ncbi:acetyltransferase [Mycolicibacillus parakoreensis]|uniref:Lysine N-acyltransferase MbtK n=1 Tax=Mycolicibacillus parakoreensis TaxID=1069221 RepID=A0ABY3U1N9_9MYCO|nr:GNAT family N-acetyltransferase [Mycolicibacillus parakoreensis]MCV7314886.1 acetyltransferase [Mycolicibacillus parakoreensis]ULN53880.1 acetyltransferase [Mycolicibacillus parakoreensis]
MTDTAPILPRELTDDLTDAVRAVPGPPIPRLAEPFAIRVVDPDADAPMIAEWMNRPHLAESWEYAWPVDRWHRYLSAQLAGTFSRPLLVSLRGKDQGYVEVYRAAKDSIGPRYDADPYDVGIHAAIADVAIINRGIAPLLLPRIVASVFDRDPRCRRIMFDPDHRNTVVRRMCEFVGCTFLGEHDMANRRMALYALARPAEGDAASAQSDGEAPNNSA